MNNERRRHTLLDMHKLLLNHREEEDIEWSKFMSLKDGLTVGEDMRRANDGEAHSTGCSFLGLRRKIGIPVKTGDAGTAVPSPLETAPAPISRFRSAAHSIILVNRLSLKIARRRVSFDSVILRDYEMTLGYQVCRQGHPVSLGWEYTEYSPISIDEFELNHPERRPLIKLRIDPAKRTHYLLFACEIPRSELDRALKANVMEQRRRKSSKEAVDRARTANVMKQQGEKTKKEAGKSCCLVS